MTVDAKPSEKIVKNPIDGMKVTDSLGRVLVLRKPDILDMYDLYSAIGDDSSNHMCFMMATKCLYVATIDGNVIQCPKSLSEFRATLKRVGDSGINAVNDAFESMMDEPKTERETVDAIKK